MQVKNVTHVTFARSLDFLLKSKGLTNIDLARAVKISHVAIGNYLKGRVPRAEILQRIADFFGVSVEAMLYGPKEKSLHTEAPPNELEVEEMLRRLRPDLIEMVTRRVHRECLLECDVKLTDSDFSRGWVDASVEYKHPDMQAIYPSKVRVSRLDPARASKALTIAIAQNDPEAVLIPSLPVSFLKEMPRKSSPLGILTPFCIFALTRAAVRMSFGEASAPKILRDLSLGYWLGLLTDGADKSTK